MAIAHKSKALSFVVPTKAEEKEIHNIILEVSKKVTEELKRNKIDARILLGGSVGKRTWLPQTHDIDFFIVFNYEKYQKKSHRLSDYVEKVLRTYKPARLKGSRDYFSTIHKGYDLEFVPVLEIKDIGKAKNITDASPLHVFWVAKYTHTDNKLANEIRLAKQFFKSADAYGAESYISGFSGYVAELLVIHYGSFANLAKAMSKWKHRVIIDIEKHHKDALKSLNPSKLESPVIVIDPLDSYRNAAAALRGEKFANAIKHSRAYLKNPSLDYFKVKRFSPEKLKKHKNTILLSVRPIKKTKAVAGDAILSKFNELRKVFTNNDFKLNSADWYWHGNTNENGYYVFKFSNMTLPKKKQIAGPPDFVHKSHIAAFKKKYKKVKIINRRYFAETTRKYANAKDILKVITNDTLRLVR